MVDLKCEFIPLYFKEKLRIINPYSSTGVITLWSKPDWIIKKLEEAGVDLEPESSDICAVGTLYGNGLPELLRNLLYNPQITRLVICGRDLSGSAIDLENFFKYGIEETDFLGKKKFKIKGSERIIDSLVTPDMFDTKPEIIRIEEPLSDNSVCDIKKAFERPAPPYKNLNRIKVDLPGSESVRFPSNPRNHNICEKDALSAWKELIFRLVRFGVRVELRKGQRLELQNVKIVVEDSAAFDEKELTKYGFDAEDIKKYRKDMLNAELPADAEYTYGYRLGAYFGKNTIDEVVENLKKDIHDRKSYISLWDSRHDISSISGHPCLVSLFFRVFEGKLTVSATFRTHNALDGWLRNFYGIAEIQKEVAKRINIQPGGITIYSQSISVDARRFEIAKCIADEKKFAVNEDPNGYFIFETDGDEIIAKHFYAGIEINQYRGSRASKIQHEIYRDLAVSDIGHAVYIGRMLEKAQMCIKNKEKFVQE